jgi:hypothetical protein
MRDLRYFRSIPNNRPLAWMLIQKRDTAIASASVDVERDFGAAEFDGAC